MLCDKDRMTAHRRLFAVVLGLGSSKPLVDKLARMREHGVEPLLVEIAPLGRTETKAAAKARARKTIEQVRVRRH